MSVWQILGTYWPAFLQGLEVTFQLAALSWGFGITGGLVAGIAAHFLPHSFGLFLRTTAFVLSSIPFLVLLYWFHFPLQTSVGIVVPPFYTATFLLATMNAVAVGEIWRGSLDDVRKEYLLAAQVTGMRYSSIIVRIQVPLAFRQALPMLLGAQVFILQSTLFASLISVEELFRVAQRINAAVYRPVEIYSGLAIFFLVICLPLYVLAFHLRRKYVRDLSER